MMPNQVLITGGTGFLGHAVRDLCPTATVASSREYDLRDRHEVRDLFRRVRPTHVVHLAARVAGVKTNAQQNVDLLEANVLINTNVLAAARECGVGRLIAVLSSCAFPVYEDRPSTERDLHAGLPFEGSLGYGIAKRLLDIHVKLASQKDGRHWTTMTPVTMYGPHDAFDLEHGHVVGALFQRCWLAKYAGEPFVVWGGGEAVRQFVYVEDIARLIVQLLEQPTTPETLIVAPDRGITIRELAESIARVMDYRGPIHFDRTKPEGIRIKRLDSECFKLRFPGFGFTGLEQGLRETARWFQAAKDRERRRANAGPGVTTRG